MKFSIVIPCYNEDENIKQLLKEIHDLKINNTFEVIIVDDFSKNKILIDGSILNILDISILRHDRNYGQSASIKTGIINSKYDFILTMDGDGQNNPADILKFIDFKLNNSTINLIQGIRSKRKDSFSKRISSILANLIRSKILKDNCKDSGCGFRFFDKEVFLNLNYFDHMHRFLPYLFIVNNYKVSYIETNHRLRQIGKSNYNNFFRFISGIIDIIGLLWIVRRRYKVKSVSKLK